jgi:hypothetical protein
MVRAGWSANAKIKKLLMVKFIDAGAFELKFRWPTKEW